MSFAFLALYTGDYLRDTRHLSPLKHGVYLLLLMHCWDQRGPLPLDEQECAGIGNCRSTDEIDALRYIIDRYFIRMEDGYYNSRIQREIERSIKISSARSDAGKKGYQAKAKQLPSKSQALASTSTPTTTTTKPNPLNATTWRAFSDAYAKRYGVPPVRNASVNTCIVNVVKRLGDESPDVAAFYLTHNGRFYIEKRHPVTMLLKDAEGLRTQWKTGTKATALEARSAEQKDSISEQYKRLTGERWK